MACLECRRRRIRCNSAKPACHHCSRLSKRCEYAVCEQRRGPKKRSVKQLEERLAILEAQLAARTDTSTNPSAELPQVSIPMPPDSASPKVRPSVTDNNMTWSTTDEIDFGDIQADMSFVMDPREWPNTSHAFVTSMPIDPRLADHNMIPDEYPKPQEVKELNKIFFEDVYPCIPIIHPRRFIEDHPNAIDLPVPICLRYSMWAHAAMRNTSYTARAARFYRNARIYLQQDEMQCNTSNFATVSHAQTWALLAQYEAENNMTPRAFMSTKQGICIVQMLELHMMDQNKATSLERPAPLALLPFDNIDAEERRRTLWYLFYADRWAGQSTGRSVDMHEEEISTWLPCPETAFADGSSEIGRTFHDTTTQGLHSDASALTAAIVMGHVMRMCNLHLRRMPDVMNDPNEHDFWKQHQQLDSMVTVTLLSLPSHLQSDETKDPLAFFTSMNLHGLRISLCEAAIAVAERFPWNIELASRLKEKSRTAAAEIVGIMRLASSIHIRKMYPFTPFLLYIASTIYASDIVQDHDGSTAKEMLIYILETTRLFKEHFRGGQMALTQILQNLKSIGCDSQFDFTEDEANQFYIYNGFGNNINTLGPMFNNINPVFQKSSDLWKSPSETFPYVQSEGSDLISHMSGNLSGLFSI